MLTMIVVRRVRPSMHLATPLLLRMFLGRFSSLSRLHRYVSQRTRGQHFGWLRAARAPTPNRGRGCGRGPRAAQPALGWGRHRLLPVLLRRQGLGLELQEDQLERLQEEAHEVQGLHLVGRSGEVRQDTFGQFSAGVDQFGVLSGLDTVKVMGRTGVAGDPKFVFSPPRSTTALVIIIISVLD